MVLVILQLQDILKGMPQLKQTLANLQRQGYITNCTNCATLRMPALDWALLPQPCMQPLSPAQLSADSTALDIQPLLDQSTSLVNTGTLASQVNQHAPQLPLRGKTSTAFSVTHAAQSLASSYPSLCEHGVNSNVAMARKYNE